MGIRETLTGPDPSQTGHDPHFFRPDPKSRPRQVDPPEQRQLPAAAGAVRDAPGFGLFRRTGWAVAIYGLVFVAVLSIASVAYTTYAFSKYQGLILPGVYVDTLSIGNQTESAAGSMIFDQLQAVNQVPITLTFGQRTWHPTQRQLGLAYDYNTTIANAFSIGRSGTFWQNLFDRLPIRRHFSVRLLTALDPRMVHGWVMHALARVIHRPMSNAGVVMRGDRAAVIQSTDGYHVNVPATIEVIDRTIGRVFMHRIPVPITYIPPRITNVQAEALATRVNDFLAHPPVLKLRHELLETSRSQLASMISFTPIITPSTSSIALNIDTAGLDSYAGSIAAAYDRQAQDPQSIFADGQVTVVSPTVVGRSMDQALAQSRLLTAFTGLHAGAVIRIPVTSVPPPADPTNPALQGVTTPLAQAQTSFVGAPLMRGADIAQIAARLNDQLIPPGQEISFNAYVSTSWPSRVYGETERTVAGQITPGSNGAMQQVATTFFRAAYSAGLTVLERHPHTYLLPWYQPPAGLDAIVSPDGSDLRFVNDSGGYLLIQANVDQTQQTISIYVYGRKTGWVVNVGSPRLLSVHSHGKPVVKTDPNLPPGTRTIEQYPHDGADYVVLRTVTKPHSHPVVDTITTNYLPTNEVIGIGPSAPPVAPQTPTTTETPVPTLTPTATSTPTTAVPTPSPTASLP